MNILFIHFASLVLFLIIIFIPSGKLISYIPYDNVLKDHSLNKINVPLLSSIIFMPTIIYLNNFYMIIIYASIYLLGYLDDKYNISVSKRFLISFFIVLVSLFFFENLRISHIYLFDFRFDFTFIFAIFYTLLMIMGFLHVMNMSDGRNCLVVLYFINIIFFIILKSYLNGLLLVNYLIILIPLILIFISNFFSKSFFGNSGILLLSFFIANLLIQQFNSGYLTIENIYILLYLPFLDGLRVTFTRIINSKSPFVSDKTHLHHLPKNWNLSIVIISLLFLFNLIIQTFVNFNFYILVIYSLLSYILLFYIFKKI